MENNIYPPVIQGYEIEIKIGSGGMATVYQGIQKKLNRKVAIKILSPELLSNQQFARRFMREAETAANLIHPHIIQIFDVGESGSAYYIIMEFLEGSLGQKIKKNQLNTELSLDIVKKIASALDYAHQEGFVHRDIKPDNILFRKDGTPVLTDFGIVKAVASDVKMTTTGTWIGTPLYMSPEQCLGENVDGRSDIYSLGVVLFEMLTRRPPYEDKSNTAIMFKHVNEPLPKLPGRLAALQPLLDLMLAKKPEKRISSGTALIGFIDTMKKQSSVTHPVEDAKQYEITTVMPTRAVTIKPPRKTVKPKRLLLPAAIMGSIVAMAFLVPQFFKKDEETRAWNLAQKADSMAAYQEFQNRFPDGKFSQVAKNKILEKQKPTITDPGAVPAGVVQESKSKPIEDSIKDTKKSSDEQNQSEKAQANLAAAKKTKTTPGMQDQDKKVTAKIDEGKASQPKQALDKKNKEQPQAKDQVKEKTAEEKAVSEKSVKESDAKTIETTSINLLSKEVMDSYNQRMERLEILDLAQGTKINKQLVLTIEVNEKGKITVRDIDFSGLEVVPESKTDLIKGLIIKRFETIQMIPPVDKTNNPVRIGSWRISFRAGTYQGKLRLNRKS